MLFHLVHLLYCNGVALFREKSLSYWDFFIVNFVTSVGLA